MSGPPPRPDAAQLLAAQLADLVRYRHVVEAQRAVLRMGDAGLLDVFSREAEGIADGISNREAQLLAVRAAAQPAPTAPDSLGPLYVEVERGRLQAIAAANALAHDMQQEISGVSQALRETTEELDRLVSGYARRGEPGSPVLLDRTG